MQTEVIQGICGSQLVLDAPEGHFSSKTPRANDFFFFQLLSEDLGKAIRMVIEVCKNAKCQCVLFKSVAWGYDGNISYSALPDVGLGPGFGLS